MGSTFVAFLFAIAVAFGILIAGTIFSIDKKECRMLNELKKYAEERAEYHHKKAQLTKENQSYHLGQRDAYATIVSIIEQGLS